MSKCDNCQSLEPTLTIAIVGGKFGSYCNSCVAGINRMANAGSASYNRDRDRENHQRDLIQPWTPDGTPNKEFIRQYPEQARENFTPEQLDQYG